MLGDVTRAADPIAERKASRAIRQFKDVAEEFLQKHVAKRKPERGGISDRSYEIT